MSLTHHVYRVLKYMYEEGNRNNQIKNKNPGNEINETILLVPYFLHKFSKDVSSLSRLIKKILYKTCTKYKFI
jgi:hypothetical protein